MYLTDRNEETQRSNAFFLEELLSYCQERNYALAIWRLPNQRDMHLLISRQSREIGPIELESLAPGFLVAAFDSVIHKKKTYLPADYYFKWEDGKREEVLDALAVQLPDFHIGTKKTAPKSSFTSLTNSKVVDFERLVAEAMEVMKEGPIKKIVLARQKTVPLHEYFQFQQLWDRMHVKFPSTFNSIIYLPDRGTWVGASPETLVSMDAQGILRTIALAGTQKAMDKTEREAVWTQKEIEEQAYVRRYIIDCLKFIRLREFEDIGPKTVRVGHLFHLRTDFIVNTKEVNFPHLLTTLLDLLHPTAAVCGTPKEKALKFILEREGFDRELYGGYLGPVNISNETFLFVNLRCAKFRQDSAIFYAGAGILQDSVAEQELAETETKMDSLLQLL